MSKRELTLVTCDRCGTQAEKWEGPMNTGAAVTVRAWYLFDGSCKHDCEPAEVDLCGACHLKLLNFLYTKDDNAK